MERFGSFIKDEGFYMSNGVVTLSKAIGDKTPRTKRIERGIFEGFDTTGFKQAKKEKRVDHKHHEARDDLHDNKKRTHIDDVQMNKNIFGETGHELSTSHRGSDIEEVGSLSSKLEQKMTPAQHKAFHHFTAGKSDTAGDGKKWASSHIAQHFIAMHKHKTENKKLSEYHPHSVVGQDKDTAEHLKTAAKPLGHNVHLILHLYKPLNMQKNIPMALFILQLIFLLLMMCTPQLDLQFIPATRMSMLDL